ncbi:MAG TPA: VOC family protein [Nocardioidaceae bacterium]|jgi:predicted 3-demethylubiquinone-9 3-methyltransferase (glyoxalase superfamily)|nr:VOC family protein [Nocardioidaceae bacterium]
MSQSMITTCLWFDTEGEEAAEFYCSVIPDSRVLDVSRYGEAGPGTPGTAMTVSFELDGKPYVALNGGPEFRFNEAVSLQISCRDQEEVDHYWNTLVEGGEESMCGWLKDRYGFSWQVIPSALNELLGDPDPDRAQRAMRAMLSMRKIDIEAMRRAADAG